MTSDDALTQEPGSESLQGLRVGSTRLVTALVIAWARDEPERVGDVVFADGPSVLGRGTAPIDGGARAVPVRQRPGEERASPLTSPRLSREQLRIEPRGERLALTSIGRGAMRVGGVEVSEREVEAGDTVLIGQELLLLVTRRPRRLAAPRAWPRDVAFEFGAPDPFGLVGEGFAAWQLRDRLAFAARADAHVLILGESGTGKELAARAIHGLSTRRDRALVSRNAATLPEGLIDAELFGNVKNYPNPGMSERPGLIGESDGGTLFLDEIGEMPAVLQAHLLRVLDRGEYQRLGDSRARRASFRLVAATNRRREELKHDLLARFAMVIEIPTLDERPEDVPMLARHLAKRAAEKSGVGVPSLGVDLVEALARHRFRLHARELEQILWQSMSESPAGKLLCTPGVSARLASDEPEPGDRAHEAPDVEPDRAAIEAAMANANGSVTRAARELGLASRYVLYRLLKKHGLASGE